MSLQIFSEDELKDLLTDILPKGSLLKTSQDELNVFVTQDILPKSSLERALESSKDLHHQLVRGMDCSEVTSWLESNVVLPKAKEKVQQTMEQASQPTAKSKASTTALMVQLAAENGDTKQRSNATNRLQDRIAARRKRVEEEKAAMGK